MEIPCFDALRFLASVKSWEKREEGRQERGGEGESSANAKSGRYPRKPSGPVLLWAEGFISRTRTPAVAVDDQHTASDHRQRRLKTLPQGEWE